MSSSTFQTFLNSVGRYPLLSKQQEILLGKQIQAWMEVRDVEDPTPEQKKVIRVGKKAYTKFFNCNVRLIISVARKYHRFCRYHTMDDLIQEGSIGMARAIEKFDPTRGWAFSTYAYWWIRQAINRSMTTNESPIRLPITAVEGFRKLRDWMPRYFDEHDQLPSMKQCAEYIGVQESTMKDYMPHMLGVSSLDVAPKDEQGKGSSSIVEMIPSYDPDPFEELDKQDAGEVVQHFFPKLNERQRHVISCRYLQSEESTYAEIGRELGISRERVRVTDRDALNKLRILVSRCRTL